ncbi:MAG TPA: exodeoxyribonuclease VII small subunit [Gammaproteobacteria bacterium]|nr:exodeoxyribonuclease VII small subunit [Gammaproteobacteria bacterium]MEC8011692.1 exodeoxyribonuclease VII small subunit [Pseudomonadota bacterium]HBF08149.1 exodeoxyribonuclease VII small subunit [Gammaproteobacteria bacterium]HCK94102.1 exodeoxyribonuclease VII small subunit [Gammaproteobacteria bacterium]|tara:strand:+ start:76 stop:324 length:249 start_codon:yes stop_codon:yes gene_type:complete
MTDKKTKETAEAPSFENSLEKLEQLVNTIENGELSLDDSLKLFEEGIQLTRSCQTALSNAEQRIKILTENNTLESLDNDPTL